MQLVLFAAGHSMYWVGLDLKEETSPAREASMNGVVWEAGLESWHSQMTIKMQSTPLREVIFKQPSIWARFVALTTQRVVAFP